MLQTENKPQKNTLNAFLVDLCTRLSLITNQPLSQCSDLQDIVSQVTTYLDYLELKNNELFDNEYALKNTEIINLIKEKSANKSTINILQTTVNDSLIENNKSKVIKTELESTISNLKSETEKLYISEKRLINDYNLLGAQTLSQIDNLTLKVKEKVIEIDLLKREVLNLKNNTEIQETQIINLERISSLEVSY